MIFRTLIDKLYVIKKRHILKRQATYTGTEYDDLFCKRSSTISLVDGSTPKDILIGNKVWMWGSLNSQSGGKIILGDYVKIATNVQINACEKIVIGAYTGIAANTVIADNNNHPVSPEFHKYSSITDDDDCRYWKHSSHAPVVIGENCWIGRNVSIMKGVTIGDNSIIAANAVVTKSVPANCIAAGNPAKVVKTDIDQIPAPTSCKGYNEYIKLQNNGSKE